MYGSTTGEACFIIWVVSFVCLFVCLLVARSLPPSPAGLPNKKHFKFTSDQRCGEPAPPILLSTFTFQHAVFEGRAEYLPALNRVKAILAASNLSGEAFAMTQAYSNWETEEVITQELVSYLLPLLLLPFFFILLLILLLIIFLLLLLLPSSFTS